jgi:hypothetical protein
MYNFLTAGNSYSFHFSQLHFVLHRLLFASDVNRRARLIGLGAQMLLTEGTFY